MKMRGNTPPAPSYSPDVAGLMQWLRQPPSQWSALGWQNAPAWADAVAFLEKERDKAIAERDEWEFHCDNANAELEATNGLLDDAISEPDKARRAWCLDESFRRQRMGLVVNITVDSIADERGWDCFRKNDQGEVTQ
jgi:hypothetical protein